VRAYRDRHGSEIVLGRFLGRGGEGAVYAVQAQARVGKIYVRTPDDQLGSKLRAMVQLRTQALASFAAWPEELVFDDSTGNVVGFLMPRVDDHRIHTLYGPEERKKRFPDASWAFLVRAARNLAATFETIHQHGHVVGDVNEGNIAVSDQAMVRHIDCDSFQVCHEGRTYACRVGVPLYTPPELQGQRLEGVVRTPDHDCFGLAVLVFQLLFMGRHPFAGRHAERAVPVATAIQEGLFAFGKQAGQEGWEPPPYSLKLSDVTPSLGELFERAFARKPPVDARRPSATEWVGALELAEASIQICNRERRHAHAGRDERCPWCRIESEGGFLFFNPAPKPAVQRVSSRVATTSVAAGRMIAIDLGTTNSSVAVMERGVPQVIPNQEGARTTPSIVGFTSQGDRLVGQIAKRQALTNPSHTVFAIKRLMGRKFDSPEVQAASRLLPYQVVRAPNGDAHVQISHGVYSPPEIASFVLKKLKAAAEDYLGEAVGAAVITVPAYFDDAQRQAVRDACLIAGLNVARIVSEPAAAALAYGLKNVGKNGQVIAVYDLGGGTFDITILEMADGLFQVRATSGDTYLGGEDFDQRIIDWLIGEFHGETGIDLKQDRMALQRLKEAAEKAKCELSTEQKTEVVLPFISTGDSGPKHLNSVLTRQKYEELTEDLLMRTIEPCRRCLADAQLALRQIDAVLLVGGQTRAPKVAEIVRKVFGREANRAVNLDEGVAMGAAIQAGIIQGKVNGQVLLDVMPHTLGIETKDGTFTPIIERNSTIPARKSRVFTTVADNQTRIEVHVLQGESDMAAYNRSLQKFELTNIPLAPRGVPQIEVGFEIDVNGIVSVEATDQATGRRQAITIHPSGGLSQADVNRLVSQSILEKEDRSKREQTSLIRQLDAFEANAMRLLQSVEGQLASGERQRVLDLIEQARKAVREGRTKDLQAYLEDLRKIADRFRVPIVGAKKPSPRPDPSWALLGGGKTPFAPRGAPWALGSLAFEVRRAFAQYGSRLTPLEQKQVRDALDSVDNLGEATDEELRGCQQALERALRLLENVRRQH
jgi:molecular chaperone DnaK